MLGVDRRSPLFGVSEIVPCTEISRIFSAPLPSRVYSLRGSAASVKSLIRGKEQAVTRIRTRRTGSKRIARISHLRGGRLPRRPAVAQDAPVNGETSPLL